MIVHGYSGFTVILILVYSIFPPDRHAPGGEQILLVVPTTEYLQYSGCGGCVQIFVQSISDQVSIWCLFFGNPVHPCAAKLFGGNLCVGKIREAGWEGILGKADERK